MLCRKFLLAVLMLAPLLPGCATSEPSRDIEIFERHAGEPVNDIRLTFLRSWRAVSRESLLLQGRRGAYYLIDIWPPCTGHLRSARTLAIPGRTRVGQLHIYDELIVDGQRCRIKQMRPLDYKAAQEEIEREPADSEP